MLAEAFPRLAIRLRSTFPDAQVLLADGATKMRVSFPAFPAWEVEVTGSPCHEQFQILQTSISMRYECMQNVSDADFHRLLSAENLGLRGATLIADTAHGRRTIQLRSSFMGQKGRTRDEAENMAIDVLSLLRFARLFDDRVVRSIANDKFSYEMYYSQYLSKSIGRNRYINYARSIFQGSTDRVFGQVTAMLKDDHKYGVSLSRHFSATITPNTPGMEIHMRIPEEIPMLTVSAALHSCAWEPERSFELVARLNAKIALGHFEVNADGSLISFVAWKHLTNDLRYYSLDQMISSVHEAELLLRAELPVWKPTSSELLKAKASSLDAYRAAA